MAQPIPSVESMVAAVDAGEAYARGLAVGQLFTGCGPAAHAAGLEGGLRRLFISAALDALPKVWTDGAGVIVRLER